MVFISWILIYINRWQWKIPCSFLLSDVSSNGIDLLAKQVLVLVLGIDLKHSGVLVLVLGIDLGPLEVLVLVLTFYKLVLLTSDLHTDCPPPCAPVLVNFPQCSSQTNTIKKSLALTYHRSLYIWGERWIPWLQGKYSNEVQLRHNFFTTCEKSNVYSVLKLCRALPLRKII